MLDTPGANRTLGTPCANSSGDVFYRSGLLPTFTRICHCVCVVDEALYTVDIVNVDRDAGVSSNRVVLLSLLAFSLCG